MWNKGIYYLECDIQTGRMCHGTKKVLFLSNLLFLVLKSQIQLHFFVINSPFIMRTYLKNMHGAALISKESLWLLNLSALFIFEFECEDKHKITHFKFSHSYYLEKYTNKTKKIWYLESVKYPLIIIYSIATENIYKHINSKLKV